MPADAAAVDEAALYAAAAARAQAEVDSGAPPIHPMRPLSLPHPTRVLIDPEPDASAAPPAAPPASVGSSRASESVGGRFFAHLLPPPPPDDRPGSHSPISPICHAPFFLYITVCSLQASRCQRSSASS